MVDLIVRQKARAHCLEFFPECSNVVDAVIDNEPSVSAVPLDVMEQKIRGIDGADACDQASSYDLRLRESLKWCLDWLKSPDGEAYMERWCRRYE